MMTQVDEDEPETGRTTPTPGDDRQGLRRWLGPLAIGLAVIPIWVALVRNGLQGLYPYSDGAETVLRARDVFDGPFPLVGMSAAGGSRTGYDVYFPGAWQLYLLSGPTRLFGVVWGPLLVMGMVNTAWVGLTGWLLLRRLRLGEALLGIAFLAALLWSLGSGFLITPVPMHMIIIPTVLFLVAVWAVADGDLVALPVLAVVANYLWLDHLVLVVTVPVVTVSAVVGLWLWLRRERRRAPEEGPVRTRQVRRSVIAAAVITFVMWIPTIVQQFTVSPGNLRLLVASSATERPSVDSWPTAVHYVISPIARPRFWFRGTLEYPSYLGRPIGGTVADHLAVYDLVVTLVLIAVFVILAVMARRRGDRTGLWLLIVAAVAVVAAVVTTYSAPTYLGPPTEYLRSVWAIAMFVWLAIAVNLVRLARGRFTWSVIIPALGFVVVFGALNLPAATYGYDSDRRGDAIVKDMNAAVIPHLEGRGTFMMHDNGLRGHSFGAALTLAMDDAGIPYCFPWYNVRSDGSRATCPREVAGRLLVRVVNDPTAKVRGELLFRAETLDAEAKAELGRLDARIGAWLESSERLTLSKAAADELGDLTGPKAWHVVEDVLATTGDDLPSLRSDNALVALVDLWSHSIGGASAPLFENSPLSPTEWRRWVDLFQANEVLMVSELHPES